MDMPAGGQKDKCTKSSGSVASLDAAPVYLLRQYLYFCTSKSSKASKASKSRAKVLDAAPVSCASVCVLSYQQYVYFCTSYIDKSSASVTSLDPRCLYPLVCVSICT
jgi:hypothetical protein